MISKGVPNGHKTSQNHCKVLETKVRQGAARLKDMIGPNQKKLTALEGSQELCVKKTKKSV